VVPLLSVFPDKAEDVINVLKTYDNQNIAFLVSNIALIKTKELYNALLTELVQYYLHANPQSVTPYIV
jgi:pyrroline-5-carboxylate reductase